MDIIIITVFGIFAVIMTMVFLAWLTEKKYRKIMRKEQKRKNKIISDYHFNEPVNRER